MVGSRHFARRFASWEHGLADPLHTAYIVLRAFFKWVHMRYVRAIYFGGHVLRILQAHVISTRFMIDLRRERELPELITSLMRQISVVNIGGCDVLVLYTVTFMIHQAWQIEDLGDKFRRLGLIHRR